MGLIFCVHPGCAFPNCLGFWVISLESLQRCCNSILCTQRDVEISAVLINFSGACRYDQFRKVLVLTHADGKEDTLHPAYVRRNDTSAASINEWTGEKIAAGGLVPDTIIPAGLQPVGNYAVLIMWEDGFNQVRNHLCMHNHKGLYTTWKFTLKLVLVLRWVHYTLQVGLMQYVTLAWTQKPVSIEKEPFWPDSEAKWETL